MAIKVWKRMPNIPWFETLSSVFGQFLSNFFVPRGLVKMITWSDPTNITLVPFFHSCVESPSPSTWIARSLIISKLFVLLTMSDCHRFVHIWYSSQPSQAGCVQFQFVSNCLESFYLIAHLLSNYQIIMLSNHHKERLWTYHIIIPHKQALQFDQQAPCTQEL